MFYCVLKVESMSKNIDKLAINNELIAKKKAGRLLVMLTIYHSNSHVERPQWLLDRAIEHSKAVTFHMRQARVLRGDNGSLDINKIP